MRQNKYCPRCQRILNHIYFPNNKSKHDGLGNQCKECFRFISRLDTKKHRERANRNARLWRINNLEKVVIMKKKSESRYKTDFNKFIPHLHRGMRQRINGKYTYTGREICSKDDFFEFAKQNKYLRHSFDRWVESGNYLWLRPTVDRIDNVKGYTLDNIQFMTHYENTCKQTKSYVSIPLPAPKT